MSRVRFRKMPVAGNESIVIRRPYLRTHLYLPRRPRAIWQLPPSTQTALEKLGADLAAARLRRQESLKVWAGRMGASIPTLQRLEAGDPTVSVGILATALWLLRRDHELAQLANPEQDLGAINRDVRNAMELGRKRSKASAEARSGRRPSDTSDEPSN